MAYRDWNGNITIDEFAAQADIKKIMRAESILLDVVNSLNIVIVDSENYKGETASAIVEKATELSDSAKKLLSSLQDTRAYIGDVVSYYQRLDQEIKIAIENLTKE